MRHQGKTIELVRAIFISVMKGDRVMLATTQKELPKEYLKPFNESNVVIELDVQKVKGGFIIELKS